VVISTRGAEGIVVVKTPKPEIEVEQLDPNAARQSGNGALSSGDVVGVDKIRDLLFGNQMQDYDRRFSKLEERFLQRFKDIEAETARNLSAFESNAKKQVESLAGQLREEKDLRADADKELERTQREHSQTVEKRLRTISDQVSQLERDLADRLTQEAQSLREEIKRKNEDMQHAIEKMFAELSNVKTDRNLLAGLFVEVAKCLNQDLAPKSKGGAEPLRGWPAG
jgi:chromosome segregation ATPase